MTFDIPFIKPRLPPAAQLVEDYDAIIASNWFTNFGPKERAFAAGIGAWVGDRTAVTFTNATIALIGLLRCALGDGDRSREVIVASFTFAAGPAAIEWAGFTPLLIDVEPDGLQPDLEQARALVLSRSSVAGILLTNTFGIGNDAIAGWEALAADAGLPLLIDSAAGFGSRYADGTMVGTRGTAEVFSFHATKPFAIGEGGAVTTGDHELADRLRRFQNFSFAADRGADGLGLNGKLAEIPAAIGLRQLERFETALQRRQDVLERYRAGLPAGWRLPAGIERSSVCFATVLAPDRASRDRARERLTAAGVEARVYYTPAVHRQPQFADAPRSPSLAVTEDIGDRVLSLPVHEEMPAASIRRVVDALAGGAA